MTTCPHCKAHTTFGRCVACKSWVDPVRVTPRTNTPASASIVAAIRSRTHKGPPC